MSKYLKQTNGFQDSVGGDFTARQRHLESLLQAKSFITSAKSNISERSQLELAAEDLRLAQQSLGSITGEFSSEDLLTEIFSSFCIGK